MKAKARYEIKNVIARGGMGIVYRAHDKMMNRLVALKTINDLSDPRAIRMFQREWQDLVSLTHPNIVEVFDVGELEVDGEMRPYLVMPLLVGQTLDELIKNSSQRLTVERSVEIICQTARGLQAAHDRGIVHRDLKPSNIFVLQDDAVKIIDFGVAGRLDQTKTLGRKGTLLYMSPEQLENKPLSAVSDIFALALVSYETLTRRRPFERSSEEEVVEAILRFMPPPASELNPLVNVAISQVIQKAMAKQSWHRFASAREFAETLQKALRNEPIESFNPAKIQGRLQRARQAFERSDLVLAGEIVGELEAEGHFNPEISELKQSVSKAQLDREITRLLESARVREEHQEYPLALQKIHEVLQLSPHHTEALAIKSRIDNRRTEMDMEEWFRVSHQHLDNFAYSHAREALQRILQLRPREPRALQMLSEVDRREQNYVQLLQQKEELYRAALEAAQNGEISQALSKAERVLDLEKQAPELMDLGRSTMYRSFYNQVRSESELLKAAYDEARAHLSSRNHAAALAICDEQLRRHPNYALFQALRVDVEEQRRQTLSARIADVDRAVETEQDLNRRVGILEEALEEYPGEPHFQRALQLTLHRRGLVESIVAKARTQEERGLFGEAITQWETLNTIHAGYPGISLELERLRRRRQQQDRVDRKRRLVEQVEGHLERNEFALALEVLKGSLEDFPEDAELTALGQLADRGLERWEESKRLFEAGREAYEGHRLEEATNLLRRAMELDDRNSAVRSTLIETLVRRAQDAHEKEPDAAESLLREALEIEPRHALAQGLLTVIEDQRRIDYIEGCVSRALQLQTNNDLRGAMKEVTQGLTRCPDEERLTHLRQNLAKALREERRKDLDHARRLERDVESAPDLQTAQYAASRLESIGTRYEDGEEFQTIIADARKHLATATANQTQTLAAMAPPNAGPRKSLPGFASNPRLLWIAGGVAGVVILLTAVLIARRPGKKPEPPVVPVQAAVQPVGPVVEVDRLTILGSGKFDLDGGQPQDLDAVFNRELPIGVEHTVNAFSGTTGALSFTFASEAGKPATVKITKENDILAFLAVSSGSQIVLYSSHKLANLKIDGTGLGEVGPSGVAIPAAVSGFNHKLEWMEGAAAKSRDIQFEKERGLVVQLAADPNLGNLVVKLNIPGPVFVVIRSSTGRDVQHETVVNGEWRPAPLRAGTYTVEAAPPAGFEKLAVPATVRKNAEQPVALDFKKAAPVPAHLLINTAAHAHVFNNGTAAGDADDAGKFPFPILAPGHYKITVRLNGYRDTEIERDLTDGQNITIDMPLTPLVGTVVLQKDPPSAAAEWSRTGDSHWEKFDGNSKELPEGQYNFRAQADGYSDATAGPTAVQSGRSVTVTLKLAAKSVKTVETKAPAAAGDFCNGWPSGEVDKNGCMLKSPASYAQQIESGTVRFQAWSNDDRLKWQIGYHDDKTYWEFELTAKSLKVTEVAKRKMERLKVPVNLDLTKWHKMTFTFKPNELRFELPDAGIDKPFTDPQSGFGGRFRIEVRKQQPVWVQFDHR